MQIINDYITRLFVQSSFICSLCGPGLRMRGIFLFFCLPLTFFRVKSSVEHQSENDHSSVLFIKTYFLFYLVRLSLIFSRHSPERSFCVFFISFVRSFAVAAAFGSRVRLCASLEINSCACVCVCVCLCLLRLHGRRWRKNNTLSCFYIFIYFFPIHSRLETDWEPDMCWYDALASACVSVCVLYTLRCAFHRLVWKWKISPSHSTVCTNPNDISKGQTFKKCVQWCHCGECRCCTCPTTSKVIDFVHWEDEREDECACTSPNSHISLSIDAGDGT